MTKITALREQRTTLAKDIRNLLDNHPGAKWGADQQKTYDANLATLEICDAEISRELKAADLNADTLVADAIAQLVKPKKGKDPLDATGLFDTFLRQGEAGFSADQRRVIRDTMSTTTGSEGGYTVPSLIASRLIDSLKAFGTMRRVAESIRTSDGKPLSYPTSDGTAEVGEWIAQNTTATAADAVFGTVSLNVFKASSKIVAVPIELLQDSVIDIEAFVMRRLAQRIGRLANTGFTIGTGTTQPDGIVPKASSGKVGTTGQTLTIIYDDVIDLIHSVDPAYRSQGAAFMTNDTLLKVLRKLKDTTNRPIWTPSYEQGIASASAGMISGGFEGQETPVIFDYIAGYPVWVNNDLAVPAANAKSMVFGSLGYYVIRDAMDVSMFRFTDSAYTKLGQVGFLAWARMGGNLLDTAAVKYYAHSAT